MAVHATPESPRTEERYFVGPHAVQRYRERVDRHATYEQARARIEAGIRGVAPCYPPQGRPIALGDRQRRFVAIVAPPDPAHGPWPSVMTVWGWGICPILLKRKRCKEGDKHYRWLNGPAPTTGAGERQPERG